VAWVGIESLRLPYAAASNGDGREPGIDGRQSSACVCEVARQASRREAASDFTYKFSFRQAVAERLGAWGCSVEGGYGTSLAAWIVIRYVLGYWYQSKPRSRQLRKSGFGSTRPSLACGDKHTGGHSP